MPSIRRRTGRPHARGLAVARRVHAAWTRGLLLAGGACGLALLPCSTPNAGSMAAGDIVLEVTLESGGGRSSAGNITLQLSLGQVDAGALSGSGGPGLQGGFWRADLAAAGTPIFSDGFESGSTR